MFEVITESQRLLYQGNSLDKARKALHKARVPATLYIDGEPEESTQGTG